MTETAALNTESQDAKGKWVSLVGVGFAGVLIVLALFLWWIFGSKIKNWQSTSSLYSVDRFPEPRLLESPGVKLAEVEGRAHREAISYSWTDSSRREAKVPIERALEITARRGLIRIPQGGPYGD